MLVEASSLTPGDLMVHADHGIGRFIGLKTIDAAGAPHDCVELEYAGGDKLLCPSRTWSFSRATAPTSRAPISTSSAAHLAGAEGAAQKAHPRDGRGADQDRGGARDAGPRQVFVPDGADDEFVTRFPYEETDDQLASIEAVAEDLAKGKPMDRLICGDVGFGKTEVALRAAFLAVMEGKQVAVVVPTTLLARQHYQTF